MTGSRMWVTAAVLCVLGVACSGGDGTDPTTSPAPDGGTSAAGPTSTADTTATTAPTTQPSPTAGTSATVSTSPNGTAAADGVCALVSTDDLASILGVDVQATDNDGGSDTCNWLTEDGGQEVVLTRSVPGNFDTCGAEADPGASGVLETVEDLEVESWWAPPAGDPLAVLTSCVGDQQLLLTMVATAPFEDEAAVRDQAVALMQAALDNA